jgi:hypothetical protein
VFRHRKADKLQGGKNDQTTPIRQPTRIEERIYSNSAIGPMPSLLGQILRVRNPVLLLRRAADRAALKDPVQLKRAAPRRAALDHTKFVPNSGENTAKWPYLP